MCPVSFCCSNSQCGVCPLSVSVPYFCLAFLLCYTKFISRIDRTPSKSKGGLFEARLFGYDVVRAAYGNGNKPEGIGTNHEAPSGNVAVKCLFKIASLHHRERKL